MGEPDCCARVRDEHKAELETRLTFEAVLLAPEQG